jgi:hypothetical protein
VELDRLLPTVRNMPLFENAELVYGHDTLLTKGLRQF